jgi:cytochrome c-type biogenesis protein CcmH
MTLWFVMALMTAAAIFAVLWPLGRRRAPAPAGSDVAVYRDQLEEVDRDRAAGRIGESEAIAARIEVSRRLLAAADAAAATQAKPAASAGWRRKAAALAALVALPAGTAGLYLALGSPGLPAAPLSARLKQIPEQPSLATLVAQVEAHLAKNPEEGRGWEVVAPVYMRLGRFDDAVKARRSALQLLGDSAEREGDLGEALVAAANGVVTADAKTAFERALALNAKDVKARFFLGVAAEQDGRRTDAANAWRDLLKDAPAGAPWTELVRHALARVDGTPVAGDGNPTPDDMAAASDLAPDQRAAMVRGMVDRLAERLKRDGADVEGWLRLVRAYTVLGERDKAQAAASDARRALGAEPDKVRRVDELVKGLGLEG